MKGKDRVEEHSIKEQKQKAKRQKEKSKRQKGKKQKAKTELKNNQSKNKKPHSLMVAAMQLGLNPNTEHDTNQSHGTLGS